MASISISGYAANAIGRSLELLTYEPQKLGANDIRVLITHCGVCHTDIQAIDNYYGITKYPFVPGHEIVGYVAEVGGNVTELKEGDRVGIGWQGRSCGHCEWCEKGEEQLCLGIARMGTWEPYGGFSSSVIVDNRFAYLLPDGMASEVVAPLMCAGITVFSALRPYIAQPAKKLGVVGIGGLGHLAIQFAHALGYEVTAISSTPQKKDEALALGADDFLFTRDAASLEQAEFSLDLLLCTTNGLIDWIRIIDLLRKKGTCILVGFPDLAFNSTDLVAHQVSITGSFTGNRATMREMLSFAHEQDIKPLIELMPMSQVNEALKKVKENRARYRIVLVNETG
jgi:alcohol/geraniol dehydrogenase (NADP+)